MDDTARRQRKESLRESGRWSQATIDALAALRQRTILESICDPAWLKDAEGRYWP